MRTLSETHKENGILVAAHRGTFGGNIPCNTMAAFDIAIKEGADIIEMDLFKNVDGDVFIFHTGKEPGHIDRHIHIETLTTKEILALKRCNADLTETEMGLEKFDDVLEHLKGRAILNLDRCVDILDTVTAIVERHGMREQVLLKSDPSDASLKMVETYASKYDYMPIFKQVDNATEKIEKMNINYMGAELVFEKEESPLAQDEYIDKMHKKGKILWVNSLIYSYKVPLAAGHSDDISLIEDPDKGWGWLADKGFDIIQTDWPYHCVDYLRKHGKRKD